MLLSYISLHRFDDVVVSDALLQDARISLLLYFSVQSNNIRKKKTCLACGNRN